ncbi:MAG: hypothetical protein H0T65_22395, partial [Deltaproteobacteria bacterium]|nr:hypothetical protein [Deltaproteobacteria bacterium]
MRWAIASLLLGLVGCDKVLGLERNPPDAPGPGICVEDGPSGSDDDGDSIINSQDKCPQFPHQIDTDDEDQDETPDACDLCPQKVGEAAGDDPDCDGLGAACDPQPMAANTRRFFGFGSQGGLRLFNTMLELNSALMPLTNTATSATLSVEELGSLPMKLETEVQVENARVYQYWSYDLQMKTAGAPPYEIQLEKREMTHNLYLVVEQENLLGEMALGQLPANITNLQFRLETTVTPTRIIATIVIEGVGTATVDVAAGVPNPFEFGMSM